MTDAQEPQDRVEHEPPRTADIEANAEPPAEQALVELLRRERADFLNYRRRVEQERATDRERARLELVRELLPLLDDLDRALAHVPEALAADPWARGIGLMHQRFLDTLRRLGIERLDAAGEPFDPTMHEAVAREPSSADTGGDTVLRVVRPGYRAGASLLRPAQVVVGVMAADVAPRNGHGATGGVARRPTRVRRQPSHGGARE